MSDLMLDKTTWDLVLENNDFKIVDKIQAIQQALHQKLDFFLGEWFLDTTSGLPYYQSILVKDPDLVAIQALMQDAIMSVDGILELLSFKFDFDNPSRQLSIAFTARSTNGPIDVNKILKVIA